MYQVDNAVIMAAGTSSRFAPLSRQMPKALIQVKGEVLIERQIRQLQQAGIPEIYIVTGYKAEQLAYLQGKFGVKLIHNHAYAHRNNHSSIHAARSVIRNSYICSADNYFAQNPFTPQVEESYYAALYAPGDTREWCMEADADGYIRHVQVGGSRAWYMLGHAFWSEEFSARFLHILEEVIDLPGTAGLFWENIFMENLHSLKMRLRKYPDGVIYEFDSLEELRQFDESYIYDTRSATVESVARRLGARQCEITRITPRMGADTAAVGFGFVFRGEGYEYTYADDAIRRIP